MLYRESLWRRMTNLVKVTWRLALNDYSNYGHLTYKDKVSKTAGKIHFHKLSFGVPTFRIVGYQMQGQYLSAWETGAYFLESHWCCLLQLLSADFLQSNSGIPLSNARVLKTTGLMRLKCDFKHKIMNANEESSHPFLPSLLHCINILRHLIVIPYSNSIILFSRTLSFGQQY